VAGRDIEQRRFPAPGGPDDGDELAMRDPEPGLFDCGVDTAICHRESHRRVVERDRHRSRGLACLHALPPMSWPVDYRHHPNNSTDRGNRQGLRRLGGSNAV
jgi:hypothetical protein